MKILFPLISLLLVGHWLAAQNTCLTASPLCSNLNGANPAAINQPSPPAGTNNFDCMFDQPNPTWYTITISMGGNLTFDITNSNNVDIDFIVWGPFPNIAAMNAACGNMGNGGASGNVVTCEYTGATAATVNITNAQVGEVYAVLVSNFSNDPTNIEVTAPTGGGAFACPCPNPIQVNYSLLPIAQNTGFMIDNTPYSSSWGLCAPGELYFYLGIKAPNSSDSLSIDLATTTINNSFPAGTFAIFPNYPTASFDTMEVIVQIVGDASSAGVHTFDLGILNSSAASGCVQVLPTTINIPSVSTTTSDNMLCPHSAQTLQLTASPQGASVGTYAWQQIYGTTAPLSNTAVANPSATIPSTVPTGDSILYEVTFTTTPDPSFPSVCTVVDTMAIYIRDVSIILNPILDTICPGDTVQLNAHLSDSLQAVGACDQYTVTSIPYTFIAGTTIDAGLQPFGFSMSAPLPIGFDFEFMCNTYTQFLASPDGYITFDLSQVFPSALETTLPDPVDPNNIIALGLDALSISTNNQVNYFTTGTAPNRLLVVNFDNIEQAGFPQYHLTGQIVLHETSNIIDLHIDTFSTIQLGGTGGFGDFATQGIENGTGTIGYSVPGRNGTGDWSCFHSSYRFAPTITTIPISYNWTPNTAISSVSVTNPSVNPQTTTMYYVSITQANCTLSDSVPITVLTNLPAPVVSCNSALVSNPTNQLGFEWTSVTGATGWEYSLDSGANWTVLPLAQQSLVLSNLPNNSCRTILVRAVGGSGICTRNSAGSILCCVQPCSINAPTFNLTQPSCDQNNGSIVANVSGGTNPLTFQWSSGQTTSTISGLTGGSYSLTTTDVNGCMITGSTTITSSGVSVTVNSSQDTIICAGDNSGSIDISSNNIGGGTIRYTWSNGATSQDLTGLSGGVYTVTVSQQLGGITCTDMASVTIAEPSPLVLNALIVQNLDCSGNNIGQLNTDISGGWGNYTYVWSNGASSNSINNLGAGSYAVTVTDAEGCSLSDSETLVQPVVVSLNATIGSSSANAITVTQDISNTLPISGGTAQSNVSYSWTPATNLGSATAISTTVGVPTPGTFIYVITGLSTDSCVSMDSVQLTVIPIGFGGMPTAFSPNGDGNNDVFRPAAALNLDVSCFRIYNRWGQLLYDNPSGYQTGWDGTHQGTPQSRDVYIYEFCYQLPGESPQALRGEFTLLR